MCLEYNSFENTMEKRAIACNKPIHLFPQCLSFGELSANFHQIWNCCLPTLSVWKSLKFVVWERVNQISKTKHFTKFLERNLAWTSLTFSQTTPGFYVFAVQVFRKWYGKRRNCLKQAISHFPTVFPTLFENFLPFFSNLELSSANAST